MTFTKPFLFKHLLWMTTIWCFRIALFTLFVLTSACSKSNFETQQAEPVAPPPFDDRLYLIPNADYTELELKFQIKKTEETSMNIYDLKGNVMASHKENFSAGQALKKIDIKHYDPGTYIVMVSYSGIWLSAQFIKETH